MDTKYSGNPICDALYGLQLKGNIVPDAWYHTIVYNSTYGPRTDWLAVLLLAAIVYWYRPKCTIDPKGGATVLAPKTAEDLLQLGYATIQQRYNATYAQAKASLVRLESLGVITRVFRTVVLRDQNVSNVMYIQLHPDVLLQLTYPEQYAAHTDTQPRSDIATPPAELDRRGGDITPEVAPDITGAPTVYTPYTDNTTDITTDTTTQTTPGTTSSGPIHVHMDDDGCPLSLPVQVVEDISVVCTAQLDVSDDPASTLQTIRRMMQVDYRSEHAYLRDAALYADTADTLATMCRNGYHRSGRHMVGADVVVAINRLLALDDGALCTLGDVVVDRYLSACATQEIQHPQAYLQAVVYACLTDPGSWGMDATALPAG